MVKRDGVIDTDHEVFELYMVLMMLANYVITCDGRNDDGLSVFSAGQNFSISNFKVVFEGYTKMGLLIVVIK